MCEDARALARMHGACEMLRRRNNLNRTFAGAKPDTSHFAYFESSKSDISHFEHFAGAKPVTSQFRRCETGHFAVSHPGHSAARHSQRVSGGVCHCLGTAEQRSYRPRPVGWPT
eukprot:COSAG06_NODE_156_length_21863_cov_29.245405_21_plen_114_part_00